MSTATARRVAPLPVVPEFEDVLRESGAPELGIDVYFGDARFVAPDAVEVAGARLRFARAVIATGGRASSLPVPGLAEEGFQNALFFGRKKASSLVIPWCTYTDPEIAHVGLYEREARERGLDVTTITVPFAEIDRAVLDGDAEGFARVHADPRSGRILGATLVAGHAGEMIGEMAVAITAGLTLRTVAGAIHPYPTQAEVWKRAGDAWNRARLTPRVRAILQRVLSFRR